LKGSILVLLTDGARETWTSRRSYEPTQIRAYLRVNALEEAQAPGTLEGSNRQIVVQELSSAAFVES
jgi:hypothetical protein